MDNYIRLIDEAGKEQNFEIKKMTMALAEIVLPILTEYDALYKIDTTEFEGLAIDGSNISDVGKMLKFKNLQNKILTLEQMKKSLELSVKIIQNVIKYSAQSEKHWKTKVETDFDSEFWKNQEPQLMKQNIEFFRQSSKLGIF